jgi:hypothetical protein
LLGLFQTAAVVFFHGGWDNPATVPVPSEIPMLQPGEHLSREEFERRYDATPGLKKAELIDIPSPAGWHRHASALPL